MSTRSAIATTLYALATVALVAAAPGCSSAEATDGESTENAVSGGSGSVTFGKTKDFAGDFDVRSDNRTTNINFSVTNIDWDAGTARWDSKIVGADGSVDNVDRNKVMKINLARCPNNCFAFTAVADNGFTGNDAPIAVIEFENGEILKMTYTGRDTKNAKLANGGGGGKGSSCVLTCEGSVVECSEGGTESTCTKSRFTEIPRCLSEVTFASTSCAAR